ncbi:ATP-dependent RNA helicase [Venturia nashicola]|nr:ATP-dependent RNA helicase [Venturia nashicola]
MTLLIRKEDRQVNGLDEAQVSNIGQIVLKLHRIEIRGRGSTRYKYAQNDDRVANSIAEKALKGRSISRKIELGATLPSGRAGYQLLKDYIDPKDRPFAVCKFRHRSMDDLYAEMIVPRPIPLEDREPESLSLEEMRELVRRQEADLQNLRRQIEENRANLSGTQGIKHELKREHDPEFGESSGSTFRRRCIETVDLTDD